jgi:uncharacterized protein YlxW (UPF0749 family)
MEETDTDDEEGEEEEEEEEEDDEEKRELRLLETKLRNTQERAKAARSEKRSLKKQIKSFEKSIKEERQNYTRLKREVDKMARLISTDDVPAAGNGEDHQSSSDSDSDDSSSESSSDDDYDKNDSELEFDPVLGSRLAMDQLSTETKYGKLNEGIKKMQDDLTKTKRCNVLLKTTSDKLQLDFNKERAKYKELEQELNHVLAELG